MENANDEFIQRIFELQNKLDQNLITQSPVDSLIYSLFHASQIIDVIKDIEKGNVLESGKGVEKVGYRFLNYVILKQKPNKYNLPLNVKKAITKVLSDQGVSTPPIVFHTNQDIVFNNGHVNDLYEVQQSAIGSPIGFSKSYKVLEYANGLESNNAHSETENNTDLVMAYNLAMLKKRTLKGIPHIEKYINNYSILNSLKVLDFHGGNVFFHDKAGYSFIDLELGGIVNILTTPHVSSFINNALENNPPNFHVFFDRINGTIMHDQMFFPNRFKKDKTKYFENFIFSGILIQQYLNAISNSQDPVLDCAKEFVENLDIENIDQTYFGANYKTLNQLYNGIKNSDAESLDAIRNQFNIPTTFNFQTHFDCESFIQAMDLTREMNNPNTQSETNEMI